MTACAAGWFHRANRYVRAYPAERFEIRTDMEPAASHSYNSSMHCDAAAFESSMGVLSSASTVGSKGKRISSRNVTSPVGKVSHHWAVMLFPRMSLACFVLSAASRACLIAFVSSSRSFTPTSLIELMKTVGVPFIRIFEARFISL